MNGFISGASLIINPSRNNPSGQWHVGYKLIYELLTDTLVSRLKVGLTLWVRKQHIICIKKKFYKPVAYFCLCEICNLEQKERKKIWDENNQETIAEAVKQLEEFDKVCSLWWLTIACLSLCDPNNFSIFRSKQRLMSWFWKGLVQTCKIESIFLIKKHQSVCHLYISLLFK